MTREGLSEQRAHRQQWPQAAETRWQRARPGPRPNTGASLGTPAGTRLGALPTADNSGQRSKNVTVELSTNSTRPTSRQGTSSPVAGGLKPRVRQQAATRQHMRDGPAAGPESAPAHNKGGAAARTPVGARRRNGPAHPGASTR